MERPQIPEVRQPESLRVPEFLGALEGKIKNLTEIARVMMFLKEKFPQINIKEVLEKLIIALKNNKELSEEFMSFIDEINKLYIKGELMVKESIVRIAERIRNFLNKLNKIGIDFESIEMESGKISPDTALILGFFVGIFMLVASVTGFGNFVVGQVLKLVEELGKAFSGNINPSR